VTRYAVRPAAVDDAERLGVVHVAVWREAYAASMPADFLAGLDEQVSAERWRTTLSAGPDGDTVLVATADDVVVGVAVAGPTRDDPPDPAFELQSINVLAAHHGTGVATALLDAVLAPAADQPVSLWVADANARAASFYTRAGFVPDGLTKQHAASGITLSRLVRRRTRG